MNGETKTQNKRNSLLETFSEEQLEFICAKAENEELLRQAKVRNKGLYYRVEQEEDDEKILELFTEIERKNKEIGLYKSNQRLGAAEHNLIKWARKEIESYCKNNGQVENFEYLDKTLFTSKGIYNLKVRAKLLDLCMSYRAKGVKG